MSEKRNVITISEEFLENRLSRSVTEEKIEYMKKYIDNVYGDVKAEDLKDIDLFIRQAVWVVTMGPVDLQLNNFESIFQYLDTYQSMTLSNNKSANEKSNFVFLFKGSPLTDFCYPFKKAANQWVARYIIVIFAIIIRCAVGLGSYSGENTPPMFGDFEAQRHWLEITTSLPITQWYFYDLEYWGLDYPPLTAYHSWLLGTIGKLIDPTWFQLNVSRGVETIDLKSFMRITALFSELLIYIPAVMMYTRWMGRHYNKAPHIDQTIIAAAILFLPDLVIIDHGHFQYNSVMLGLALMALNNLLLDNYILASILFTLSIGFKQMAFFLLPVSNRVNAAPVLPHSWFWKVIIVGFYCIAALIEFCDFNILAPPNLPDIWTTANACLSFASFFLLYLWINYKILRIFYEKTKLD
ncbi:hypothetical protein CANINC_000297 [Pichia inconspicua]|uniref:Alpha-1,3-glucosyltransferase n=1 Tax=Pichia inconspicua TaxID=52247 RepID=A0A4T0X6S9_9ASCO|nr:hypothetical protein CANINC_000297 [[Candida] inconspicua]